MRHPRDRFISTLLALGACMLPAPLAAAGDDPCDDFSGPFPPCTGPFRFGVRVCSASYYPEGIAPFHSRFFPLIQVCGDDCEPCLFPPLTMDLKFYPYTPLSDFLCDVVPLSFPAGTSFVPDILAGNLFPTGDCPFELTVELPPKLVVCPGDLYHELLFETHSEYIPQGPGGGARRFEWVGFLLICMKSQKEAEARSLGVIPIVGTSEVVEDGMIATAPFAIANPSGADALVNIIPVSSRWPIVSDLPPAIPLAAGESTTIAIQVAMPPGTPIGTSNEVTVTVDLDGIPGTAKTETVELVVVEPEPLVPICPGDCAPVNDNGTFGDGVIDVNDILAVLGAFGTADSQCDIDANGVVDVEDLLAILGAYGPCRL